LKANTSLQVAGVSCGNLVDLTGSIENLASLEGTDTEFHLPRVYSGEGKENALAPSSSLSSTFVLYCSGNLEEKDRSLLALFLSITRLCFLSGALGFIKVLKEIFGPLFFFQDSLS